MKKSKRKPGPRIPDTFENIVKAVVKPVKPKPDQ